MHFDVFATGHCIFHDIDEDPFIISQIVLWYVCYFFNNIYISIDDDTSFIYSTSFNSKGIANSKAYNQARLARCIDQVTSLSGLKKIKSIDAVRCYGLILFKQ